MILIPLLPDQESFAGMGEITRLKMVLQLTGEEADELVALGEDGSQRLDNIKAAAHIREIPISEWMTKTIRTIFTKMNEQKKIKENQLSLYEKFCLDYDKR
jgi:hypothetical protein